MSESTETLLENNVQWARDIKSLKPDFFSRLAEQQSPDFLWIGCADSRVPANQIIGLSPGRLKITVVDPELDDTQDPMQTALMDYRTSL